MYIINTIPHGKCFVRYLRTRCFCIKNLTRSLRSLVRFLIRQQLVRKYRTPALSMKYSLFSPPCLLSNLKHALPLTTRKTVFSHLKRGVYAHVYTSFLSFCGFFVSRLLTFPSYFINAILFYFILLEFNKSN